MPSRPIWKGYLKLSLISIPVKAFTATPSSAGEVRMNQLHAKCGSRIKYKKTCPIHGEVTNDEIISGYEYSKDRYVTVDPEELDKLRTEDDKAVKIDRFLGADAIDPIYQDGRSYYLVPEGKVGEKPYAVLRDGMLDLKRQAIAQVVMHGKEQLVLLRPMDGILVMTVLKHDPQVIKPATFKEDLPSDTGSPEELKLIKTLIEASTDKKVDLAKYKDAYAEKLTKLIEAKVAGEEIVAPPAEQEGQIINLMDALKKSVEQVQGGQGEEAKPPKKMAASNRADARETRRKKSS